MTQILGADQIRPEADRIADRLAQVAAALDYKIGGVANVQDRAALCRLQRVCHDTASAMQLSALTK